MRLRHTVKLRVPNRGASNRVIPFQIFPNPVIPMVIRELSITFYFKRQTRICIAWPSSPRPQSATQPFLVSSCNAHACVTTLKTGGCVADLSFPFTCRLLFITSKHKLVVSHNFLSIRIVLSCFHLLIFYFEKFWTWICCRFAVCRIREA